MCHVFSFSLGHSGHSLLTSDATKRMPSLPKSLLRDRKIGKTSHESWVFCRRFRATDSCGPKPKKKGPDLDSYCGLWVGNSYVTPYNVPLYILHYLEFLDYLRYLGYLRFFTVHYRVPYLKYITACAIIPLVASAVS